MMHTHRHVNENAADHVSGAVGGNMYDGHLQDEEFDGNVRKRRMPSKRFTAVDDSAYRQVGDGPPAGAIAEDDELDPYVGEGRRLLHRLVHEALNAQHSTWHTAPVYEDDDALDDVDEMSAGGAVGAPTARGTRLGEAAPSRALGGKRSVGSTLDSIQAEADRMMTSAWHSDVDEPHFRHTLESMAASGKSPGMNGRIAALIDNIIREMSTCSDINSDIRSELADNGDDELADDVQEMQGESDKHHLKAMALIEKFFKSYVAGAK